VPVLAPGMGRTVTGRLWTVVRDEAPWCGGSAAAAFYRYSRDRKAEHAEALLGSCRGYLHADGYAGFNSLYDVDHTLGVPRLIEVACWAHVRRKLYDVHPCRTFGALRRSFFKLAKQEFQLLDLAIEFFR